MLHAHTLSIRIIIKIYSYARFSLRKKISLGKMIDVLIRKSPPEWKLYAHYRFDDG